MKITVFGAGYVGLVVAGCFSKLRHTIRVVDVDPKKIAALNEGIIPIYEPGLESLFRQGLDDGLLSFTLDVKEALNETDIVFIAVGTPSLDNGHADVSYVLEVADRKSVV